LRDSVVKDLFTNAARRAHAGHIWNENSCSAKTARFIHIIKDTSYFSIIMMSTNNRSSHQPSPLVRRRTHHTSHILQTSNMASNSTEIPWIDAWIRWERDSKDTIDDDHDDDDKNEEHPSPTESFQFEYPLPTLPPGLSSQHTPQSVCTMNLRGFPSESEQIWNSTGLTLWPCSHFLCEYLCEHLFSVLPQFSRSDSPRATQNTINVLELGSGLGRCGILVHHLLQSRMNDYARGIAQHHRQHHHHVYLTDGDTDTLYQLRENVSENVSPDQQQFVSCHQLLWGRDSTTRFCDRLSLATQTGDDYPEKEITGDRNTQVDLVIGSDLIYVPQVIQPLFETISVLLQESKEKSDSTQGTSMFLMAHSNRRKGSSVTLDMVLKGAAAEGLEATVLREEVADDIFIISFVIPGDKDLIPM
jgi:Lysine methyltransferase